MSEFITEELLAKRLGLNRDALKPLRPEGTRTQKNAVEWPWAEAQRVATLMNLDLVDGGEEAPGELLTVSSAPGQDGWHFGNHHLIKAKRADGTEVVVRVVASNKYAPRLRGGQPMVLRARKAEEGNWWLLVGREPRAKGMW